MSCVKGLYLNLPCFFTFFTIDYHLSANDDNTSGEKRSHSSSKVSGGDVVNANNVLSLISDSAGSK
ncbi:MAG: hypothetical protein ACREOZ_03140 [Gloeomargaritales cyanobacterium]